MPQFIKKHPFIVMFVIVAVLGVTIALTRGNRSVTGVENAVGSVLTPVESVTTGVTRGVGNWFRLVLGISDVQRENEQLRERIVQMEGDIALLGELEKENQRLSEIANFVQDNESYDIVTASVVGKSPGYWFDTFALNVGRNNGVQEDMPVITPTGLVGRVYEVGGNWCKVMSIIDSDSSVSALIERTRDNTVVRGAVTVGTEEDLCTMVYLPLENDLVPGDKVLTSGLGGIFPKGLMIGEVLEVSRAQETTERTATIKPAVDFMNLEEVMVIKQVYEQVSP